MLLLSKVVPLLVTAVFALALGPSGYPPPPPPVRYARLGFLGHRLWRLSHPPEPPPSNALLVLPPPQLPRLLLPPRPFDTGICINDEKTEYHKSHSNKVSPSLRQQKRQQQLHFSTINNCACPMVEGFYDQGAGMYPRFIKGTECLREDNKTPVTMRNPKFCNRANAYFKNSMFCRQKTITMYFLTERNDSLSHLEAKDEEEFPGDEDLKDKWMYITRDINSSCEYTGD